MKRIWRDMREKRMQRWARTQWNKNKPSPPKKCQCCGATDRRLAGHHPSYFRPLFVVWVCPKCHGKITAWTIVLDYIKLGIKPPKKTSITFRIDTDILARLRAWMAGNPEKPSLTRSIEVSVAAFIAKHPTRPTSRRARRRTRSKADG